MVKFAVNHVTVAHRGFLELLDLAADTGCIGVELRTDLERPLFDGLTPSAAAGEARSRGLRILALSEVSRFDVPSDATLESARDLIEIAVACGSESISLIPRNDGEYIDDATRLGCVSQMLTTLAPWLESADLVGHLEPLGFASASLRHKSEAVQIIETEGLNGRIRLVHDTFHHYLAGGGPLFPEHTGIVHVSGVADSDTSIGSLLDEHRELVQSGDRLGNLAQLRELAGAGWSGPVSMEAFSPAVHSISDPQSALCGSFQFIASSMAEKAA